MMKTSLQSTQFLSNSCICAFSTCLGIQFGSFGGVPMRSYIRSYGVNTCLTPTKTVSAFVELGSLSYPTSLRISFTKMLKFLSRITTPMPLTPTLSPFLVSRIFLVDRLIRPFFFTVRYFRVR